MQTKDPKLKAIWKQDKIPVVFRREKSNPLLVRLPYAPNNFVWLRGDKLRKPDRNDQFNCWEVPVAWFDWLIERLLKRFAATYVIQLYREQQKCAPACWNAKGLDCECSCMGQNHGSGHPDGRWHEVSETFAFEWGPQKYACRLLVPAGEAN